MISRATNPASTKWGSNTVPQSLQLNREAPTSNVDVCSALNVPKRTDNNTLQSYHPNRVNGSRVIPLSNSEFDISYLKSTINHRGEQNLFYPADVKSNENQLMTFISPSKCKKLKTSCHMKNYIRNELPDCVDQEHEDKDTRMCRIYSPKENDRPAKRISDVFKIEESTTNLFENMLETQTQACGVIRESSLSSPLRHAVLQKSPLQDCCIGRGTELSNEEQLVLSYDAFDMSDNSILDKSASDKLQKRGNQTSIIDATLNKVVTQDPNYFMQCQNSNSIMENDCYKGDELFEKYPSQNNFSTIQPFMTVTVTDKGQGSCVLLQDINYNEDIGTGNIEVASPENESHNRNKKDMKALAASLLHEAEFHHNSSTTSETNLHRSHKTIQQNTCTSSKELITRTSNQSHGEKILSPIREHSSKANFSKEKECKNLFAEGRYYMSMKGKLEVPGTFQKIRETKNKPYSNHQITYSAVNLNGSATEMSTKNIEDVAAGTLASSSKGKRKTFQTPFKKMPSQAIQVLKLTLFFLH
jgi:hypothetical protein